MMQSLTNKSAHISMITGAIVLKCYSFLISLLLGELSLFFLYQVTLFFAGCLYRGNRSTKVSAGSFDAFASPNLPPLVTMKVNIEGKIISNP